MTNAEFYRRHLLGQANKLSTRLMERLYSGTLTDEERNRIIHVKSRNKGRMLRRLWAVARIQDWWR